MFTKKNKTIIFIFVKIISDFIKFNLDFEASITRNVFAFLKIDIQNQ